MQLPDDYYWHHFKEVLAYLGKFKCALLCQAKQAELAEVAALPEDAQKLLVRLYNRKGRVIATDGIKYTEINDIEVALNALTHSGWLEPIASVTADVLAALTKPALQDMCEKLRTKGIHLPNKSATKASWLEFAIAQQSAFSVSDLPQTWLLKPRLLSWYFWLYLYFGRFETSLTHIALRDLGLKKTTQTRAQARFSSPVRAANAFYWRMQKVTLKNELKSLTSCQVIKRFESAWLASSLGKEAKRLKQHVLSFYATAPQLSDDDACTLLPYCQSESAREKHIRLLFKLGQKDTAKRMLEAVLEEGADEELMVFASDFLARKYHDKRTSVLTDILRASKAPITLDDAFKNEVEDGVISHLKEQGEMAIFSENHLWRALFMCTFWDLLINHPKAGFAQEQDTLPEVFKHDTFFEELGDDIQALLTGLNNKAQFYRHLLQTITRYYGQLPHLVTWHQGLFAELKYVCDAIPFEQLMELLLQMSQHIGRYWRGWPDLVVINQGQLRFCEVKAQGDSLRRAQLVMLNQLNTLGFSTEIQRVEFGYSASQKYAVVDIETTGGRKGGHRITEIAVVIVQNGKVLKEASWLVNPERPISRFITELTGISNDMVKEAPRFFELAQEIKTQLTDCVFVAHNVNFDYGFFKDEFARINEPFKMPKLCTVALSRHYFKGLKRYGLAQLCAHFDIPLTGHHRALNDARATAKLFELINQARKNA